MGNASVRHLLGLLKLNQVCHEIFTFLLNLRNRGNEPNQSDDTFLKGHAGTKKREGEGSLRGRKMQRLRGIR